MDGPIIWWQTRRRRNELRGGSYAFRKNILTANTLAVSHHYAIQYEYEIAYLCMPNGRKVVIGDFYGDPQAAVIAADETWCAIGGCGLIVYRIAEPFEEYVPGKSAGQYLEFHRSAPDVWWVTEMKQSGAFALELRMDGGAIRTVSF